jgi:hypothetical protein
MQRPRGITALAVLNYFEAGLCIASALGVLFAPHLMSAITAWWDSSQPAFKPDDFTFGGRGGLVFLFCVVGVFSYFYARGFWQLKNWARVLCILASLANISQIGSGDALQPLPQLFTGILAPALWPHSPLVISGLLEGVVGRIVSLAVLIYLLRPKVSAAFAAGAREWMWVTAAAALAIFSLSYAIYHSGRELDAIRWHAKHGNQLVVNGVIFPVDFWSVPIVYGDSGFTLEDSKAGPLRPRASVKDMRLEVDCGAEAEGNLTPQQSIEEKVQSYHRSGYTELTRSQERVANETLDCITMTNFDSFAEINCYGDGPISSVSYLGAPEQFHSIMARAK